jgi:hypothetical protein
MPSKQNKQENKKMGSFGVNMNEFEGKLPSGGFVPPDDGPQEFEIVSVSEGIISKGDQMGERYLSVKCVQTTGPESGAKSHNVFLGLSQRDGQFGKPIEQTKGWLESWGRLDLFDGDADVQELIGTTFAADVRVVPKEGSLPKVYLTKIEALSHVPVTPPEPAPAKPAVRTVRGR